MSSNEENDRKRLIQYAESDGKVRYTYQLDKDFLRKNKAQSCMYKLIEKLPPLSDIKKIIFSVQVKASSILLLNS